MEEEKFEMEKLLLILIINFKLESISFSTF